MGRHRADIEPLLSPLRSVVQAQPDTPAPYVGKRRVALLDSLAEPAAVPPVAEVTPDLPVPTTGELQAILDRDLDETAPQPRVVPEETLAKRARYDARAPRVYYAPASTPPAATPVAAPPLVPPPAATPPAAAPAATPPVVTPRVTPVATAPVAPVATPRVAPAATPPVAEPVVTAPAVEAPTASPVATPPAVTPPTTTTAATAPVVVPRLDDTVTAMPRVLDDRTSLALPRITFTEPADATSPAIPVIKVTSTGGRRRRRSAKSPLVRKVPSLPLAAGLASLAAVVTGVAVTSGSGGGIVPVASHRLVEASAFGGNNGGGSIGRPASLSRGDGRDGGAAVNPANSTGQQRTDALAQANVQAGSYDAYLAKNQWTLPIEAGHYILTGRFGQVSGLWATIHTGLDFACPTGTPIHAVAGGVITEVGWAGAYGNRTVETLPDGTELWYAHQSRFGVTVGEHVTENEVIGYVGATGNVTGPHVHLEVRPGGGDPVDPDQALLAHGIDPDTHQE